MKSEHERESAVLN